ncbi:MAG: hypothetical protein QOF48_3582, partial [Verrucomicrobiota bacterium]
MNTISYWRETEKLPKFRPPNADVDVDVAVVGAGITG